MVDEITFTFDDVDFESFAGEEIPDEIEIDDPLDALPPVKRNMVLFFLIDVSESMKGERIRTMNEAMREVLPELVNVGGTLTDVKIAVLEFSSGCEWISPKPVLVEEFQQWKDLVAGGVTDLGMALLELNSKMSRKQFLYSPSLSYAPVIFLITDGYPTDNYKEGIRKIKENRWFEHGIKIALALGNGVDKDVLCEFTDDPEFIVEAHDMDALKSLVQTVALTSSQIGSSSMPVTESAKELTPEDVSGMKQEQMRDALKNMKKDILQTADMQASDFDEGW